MLKNLYAELPEYDSRMYLKGHKPEEIINSLHKTMIEEHQKADDEIEVVIITKEKKK